MTDNFAPATLSHDISSQVERPTSRRAFMAGAGALGGLLVLPGCTSGLGGFSFTDAIRRMLLLSSERAFARLTSDGGYWDDAVANIGLSSLLGTRGNVLSNILTSALFKSRLEDAFVEIAEEGAYRAAPIVADTVRTIGFANAVALVRGGPTAATEFLRGNMGETLISAMVPEIGQAMRLAQDPLVGQLISGLVGIDLAGVSRNFSANIDNAIWREMGIEEAAIRANPRETRDPLLIGVFGAAGAL